MSAGFKYQTVNEKPEERYDVSTGLRRRGPYALEKEGVPVGTKLPDFMPIYADLINKKAYMCINVRVYADAKDPTALNIDKGSPVMVGMFLGNGTNGAQVASVDKTNEDYDTLTFTKAFGTDLKKGDVLFRAKAVDGLAQMYVANSALYNREAIQDGPMPVALLRAAAEIEPQKLVIPFTEADKENLKGWFQFND